MSFAPFDVLNSVNLDTIRGQEAPSYDQEVEDRYRGR